MFGKSLLRENSEVKRASDNVNLRAVRSIALLLNQTAQPDLTKETASNCIRLLAHESSGFQGDSPIGNAIVRSSHKDGLWYPSSARLANSDTQAGWATSDTPPRA